MKRRALYLALAFLLIVTLVGLLAACKEKETTTTTATSAETKGQVLRLAAPWPVGDPVTNNIQDYVDKFNAQAGGRYTIELHPGGQLLALPDSFEAVRTGAVEMAGWPVAVFGSIVPEFNLAELPFAVNSIEADAAFNVEMTKLYDKVLTEKHNMKPVFNFTCQGLDIISVKPVRTLEDWKGLLCQTISPVTAKVVELLGGSGVAMEFSEGYQAMQKKVIEASLQSGSMIIMFKMNEVGKYLTRAYLTPASIGVFINLDVYNKMPDDIKKLIDQLGQVDQQAVINANMIELYKTNYAKMTELGIEVYPLPGAERQRWAERLKPYADELLGKVDPATADQVRQITQKLDEQFPYKD